MKNEPIPGGFAMLARATLDSRMWSLGPDCRSLAIWLILRARFDRTPSKFAGFDVGRGEVLTSLSAIADDCAWRENRTVHRWSREKVRRMLAKLCEVGFCLELRDSGGTHIRLCNYDRYQLSDNYNSHSNETTPRQLRDNCETTACTYNKGKKGKKGKNDQEHLLSDIDGSDSGDMTTGDEEQPAERRQSAREREAERIYAAYPKKVGKAAAVKSIEKALKSGVSSEQLLSATEQFARAVQGADMQYVPNPATWYNQARWEDDPALWATIGRDRATGQNATRGTHSGLLSTQVFHSSEDISFPEERNGQS